MMMRIGVCVFAVHLHFVAVSAAADKKSDKKSNKKKGSTTTTKKDKKNNAKSSSSSSKSSKVPKIKTFEKPLEPQTCQASLGFDGSPVYDKNHILPSVCGIHNSRTCCEQRHVRWVAAKLLAMQRAEFNDACVAATRQALCGLCDGDFGTGRSAVTSGQTVVLCPHLCGEWYSVCKEEYFSGSLLNGLNPCTDGSLLCSKLKDIEIQETEGHSGTAVVCQAAFGGQFLIDDVQGFESVISAESNTKHDARRKTRKKAEKVAKGEDGGGETKEGEEGDDKSPEDTRLARPCPSCYDGIPAAIRYGPASRPPDSFKPTKIQEFMDNFRVKAQQFLEEFGMAMVLLLFFMIMLLRWQWQQGEALAFEEMKSMRQRRQAEMEAEMAAAEANGEEVPGHENEGEPSGLRKRRASNSSSSSSSDSD